MSIRTIYLALCAIVLGAAAPAPAAQGLAGDWRNTNNTVHLRLTPCGPAMCGTVTWANETARKDAKKGSGRDLLGSRLLHDLRLSSDGVWRGKIFVPDLNKNASGTVTVLSDDLIRVSGCLFLGLACRTQHWHRMR